MTLVPDPHPTGGPPAPMPRPLPARAVRHDPDARPAASPGAVAAPEPGPDLRYILRIISGRRWMIAGMTTVATVLIAAATLAIGDRYTATATLLVDDGGIRLVRDGEPVQPRLPGDDSALMSEVEILRSPRILDGVIDDLGLLGESDGNGEPGPAAMLRSLLAETARTVTALIWSGEPPEAVRSLVARLGAPATPIPPQGRREKMHDRLSRHLTVRVAGRSNVVEVQHTAGTPERAAAVVNAVVARYLETRRGMDRAVAGEAIGVLRSRIEVLRRELVTAEHEVERLRFASGLTRGLTGPLAAQDLEQARQRLTQASSDRARLVAQAEALERAGRSGGGSIASPTVAQLRTALSSSQAEMAQLSRQYGPRHPRVIELQGRIDETRAALGAEVQREIAGVREAANVAIAQEKALKEMIAGLEGRYAANLGDQGVTLRGLEAEAQAKRSLMEGLLRRLEEIQAVEDGRAAPGGVKLVAPATVPFEPSGPPRLAFTGAGFIGSGLLSVFFVFAVELARRRVRGPDDIRRILGLATVHVLPRHEGGRRRSQLHQAYQTHPYSAFSESLRALYRNRLGDTSPFGAVAVTSARPRDGKTAISLAVAQVAAQAGRRVVVVDTDFRRSRIEGLFRLEGKPGLADWLAGRAALDAIIETPAEVPFALVPAGRIASAALDHFTGEAVNQLLTALSPNFDLIVLDTAPALAVSDARIVCAAAQRVLFVTRWGHTTAGDLQAVADLGPIDHDRFVCVLTDVDLKRARAGYAGGYHQYATDSRAARALVPR